MVESVHGRYQRKFAKVETSMLVSEVVQGFTSRDETTMTRSASTVSSHGLAIDSSLGFR